MRQTIAAAAIIAALGATSVSAATTPCEKVTMADGSTVLARKLPSGNLSVAACEQQVTVKLTDSVAPGTFEVQPKVTATRCAVKVNDDNGKADVVPQAWHACIAAMQAAAK